MPALERKLKLLLPLLLLFGCKSAPAPQSAVITPPAFPPRPTVAPPAFKVFHQDNDTYTLVTSPTASDDEIAAILYQLHDASRTHTFNALHLSQSFVDARRPIVWFHVYRGSKCASEKFTKGAYPCGAKYNGAGDYTLGDYKNPTWDDAVVYSASARPNARANAAEIHLWNPDAPASKCQEPPC